MDITTKSAEAQTTLRAVKSRLATMSSKKSKRGPSAQFFRHLAEMYGAMVLGMVILGPLYQLLMRGLGHPDPAQTLPELSALVAAFSMTVPMVAWMRYRGHSWRSSAEMAAVMFGPALALIALSAAGAISSAAIEPLTHAFMCPGMLVLMVIRRKQYTGHQHKLTAKEA